MIHEGWRSRFEFVDFEFLLSRGLTRARARILRVQEGVVDAVVTGFGVPDQGVYRGETNGDDGRCPGTGSDGT